MGSGNLGWSESIASAAAMKPVMRMRNFMVYEMYEQEVLCCAEMKI